MNVILGTSMALLIVILFTWILSMRSRLRQAEELREGVEYLLRQGVVPGMPYVNHERTNTGFIVRFEGPLGPRGPNYAVAKVTMSDGQVVLRYSASIP